MEWMRAVTRGVFLRVRRKDGGKNRFGAEGHEFGLRPVPLKWPSGI